MISETDAAERISGKNSVERKNVRSQLGIFDWTRIASSSATASWTTTAVATKPMVLRNETRTVGLEARRAKLSKPTNSGAVMMSQRKNARTTEATIGRKLNSASPITVGARNREISSRGLWVAPERATASDAAGACVEVVVDISVLSVRVRGRVACSPARGGPRLGRW